MRIQQKRLSKGFALIATISVLSLLVMIAIGMLSLASVTTRTSEREIPMHQAKANARMALMIALGELQKMAGPDTRVTAPADAVAGNTGAPRQVTGVWRSWEGNDHDKATGLPSVPDYGSKLADGDLDSQSSNTGRFLGWLVSGEDSDNKANNPPSVGTATSDTVPLLSEGTLGDTNADEVHLQPTQLGSGGAYAWWIQGGNQKALVQEKPEEPEENDSEAWADRLASSGWADAESLGFEEELVNKAISWQSMNLAAIDGSSSNIAGENFHDITAYAHGLLTNTANGGWRKDLSLMAEKWDQDAGPLANAGLPIFSAEPHAESLTASLKMAASPTDASIYPWVEEVADNYNRNQHASLHKTAMSWNALLDFVSLYKKVQKNGSSGEPYFNTVPTNSSDWVSIQPIPVRVHMALGFDASINSSNGKYVPRLLFKPATTMWNPYNVAIEQDITTLFHFDNMFPINLYAKVGNQPESLVNLQLMLQTSGTSQSARFIIGGGTGDDATWKPGESRIYGKDAGISNEQTNWGVVYQDPGFSLSGSMTRELSYQGRRGAKASTITEGDAGDSFSFRIDHKNNNLNKVSGSLSHFWSRNKQTPEGQSLFLESSGISVTTPFDTAREKMPLPDLVNDSQTLQSAYDEDSPFLVISLGLRTLKNEDILEDLTKIHTKGYINTKPISPGVEMFGGVSAEDSAYTFEVFAPNSWADPFMPQSDDLECYGVDHSSYVGSSFQSGLGLNRWVIAELPTRPLLSLGELQHFDISFRNQFPPRVFNAIGNSHATPHVASDQVRGALSAGSYDHSYVSNHVFFDDWFFSSITPDVDENRTIEQVYADHLSFTSELPNRQYLPASREASTTALQQAEDTLADTNVWQDIASKLEVRGMFNINSTSKEAWKAVLSGLRETQVPYAAVGASSPDDWEVNLTAAEGTPSPRTTVAGDPASATDTSVASIARYNELTNEQIEALAEGIVEQVKKRGPFLSLSEFVNRRLGADEDLAMAGAIESALIELSKLGDSSNNPYKEIQNAYPEQAVLPSDAATIYEFPNAAVGDAAYGTPGWIRQADILRPLAPIISARDDSFVIRAYGESQDADGNVLAKAWCEAVVQRKADYVDQVDSPSTYFNFKSDRNKEFGRGFKLIAFRWLSPDEV
ncbi:hypothetical protein [Rubritalea sp.]|uniref:hypothetical protein n=1 Tax=Rubritalea sp. TaxID=2109375 RepID=UPI003EF4B0A1